MGVSQREGKPHFGSVVSRVQGPSDPVVPPFVDLFPTMQHKPYNAADAGHLGSAYRAAKVNGDDLALLRQSAASSERLTSRRGLLSQFDRMRRIVFSTSRSSSPSVSSVR